MLVYGAGTAGVSRESTGAVNGQEGENALAIFWPLGGVGGSGVGLRSIGSDHARLCLRSGKAQLVSMGKVANDSC